MFMVRNLFVLKHVLENKHTVDFDMNNELGDFK